MLLSANRMVDKESQEKLKNKTRSVQQKLPRKSPGKKILKNRVNPELSLASHLIALPFCCLACLPQMRHKPE